MVGVHAPEFEFGKRAENIDRGIRDHGLTYPIAIDNDFATWRALGNDAWPAKYLFDGQGRLVKRWVGEGQLRRNRGRRSGGCWSRPSRERNCRRSRQRLTAFAKTGEPSYAGITNETYVGADRREPGTFTLEGDWRSGAQYLELRKGSGKIILPFTAGEVNLVMQPGPSGKRGGHGAARRQAGRRRPRSGCRPRRRGALRSLGDVSPGRRRVQGRHVLTLVATDPGLRAFVFTFGP